MTGYFFDQTQTGRPLEPGERSSGPLTGFFANAEAAFGAGRATELMISNTEMLREATNERRRIIEEITGTGFFEAIAPHRGRRTRGLHPREIDGAVQRLKATLPAAQAGRILTGEAFQARAREIALERVARNADIAARGRGIAAGSGQVAGAVGAQATDPLVLATLPAGAPLRAGWLLTMGVEASLAAGVTAAQQPAVQKWRAELGLEAGAGEALTNIATAGVLGAAAGGAMKALDATGRAVMDKLSARQLLEAHEDLVPSPSPAEETARQRLRDEIVFAEQSPFPQTPRGEEAHVRRTAESIVAAEGGRRLDLPPPPDDIKPAPRAALGPRAPMVAAEGIWRFDPDDLAVDATRFQFKAGGDVSGVTGRLTGVGRWDPARAGIVLVWEDSAGRRFIADGHQRLALARRIRATDIKQRPQLTGYLFREADGITAAGMRAIAAAKNIAEGTGSVIDAAKILRDAPELALDLPPRSALVRDANGLAHLSDDAFGMVVNERVAPDHAALLGRIAPDRQEIHAQVLGELARAGPRNQVEAESIIRDVLSAPEVRAVQESLFGAEEVAELLLKERARILSAAARRIAKDRAAFRTIVREERRFAEAGNVLETEANITRASDDAQILEILQQQARGTGSLAQALARSARDLKRGAGLNSVTSRFIDDARRAAAETFQPGRGAGRPRPGGEGPDDGGARAEPRSAGARALDDGLDPPAAPALTQIPGIPTTIWRGSGRTDRASVYSGPTVPVMGRGRYWAFDEQTAREFGPNVEQAELMLQSPLVIRSDEAWRALTREAGWDVPNLYGQSQGKIEELTAALRELVLARGHDGVIVHWDDAVRGDIDPEGRGIKLLRNVLGDPQVVDYRVEAPGARSADRAASGAPPSNDDLLALADPGSDAMRAEADQLAADLTQRIDQDGDFEVPAGDGDGTVSARALVDEAQADAEFADQLGFCLK